jgi:hypothetical protein
MSGLLMLLYEMSKHACAPVARDKGRGRWHRRRHFIGAGQLGDVGRQRNLRAVQAALIATGITEGDRRYRDRGGQSDRGEGE